MHYRWQTYTEPGDEIDTGIGTSPTKRTSRTLLDSGDELEPAPEGVLARNMGLDLIVVVNKTDFMVDLEKDYDYKDEHFDFIQQAVSLSYHFHCVYFIFFCSRLESFVCNMVPVYFIPV